MRPLKSARLHLRPLREADQDLYREIYTDATLMRHVGHPLDEDSAQRAFLATCRQISKDPPLAMYWVMEDAAEAKEVGLVALVWRSGQEGAEIGAMVLGHAHRAGYATEAMCTVIDHAFRELGLSALWGHHPSSNAASVGLMRKLGFLQTPPTLPKLDCRWELSFARWAEFGLCH